MRNIIILEQPGDVVNWLLTYAADQLDLDTLAQLQRAQLRQEPSDLIMEPHTIYKNLLLEGASNTLEIFKSNDEELQGICNLNAQRLHAKNEVFVDNSNIFEFQCSQADRVSTAYADKKGIVLRQPRFIKAESRISSKLIFADGQTVNGANDLNLSYRMHGWITKQRGQRA